MPSAPALRLELRPSRVQRVLPWLLAGLASLALLSAPWPLSTRALALLVYVGLVWLAQRWRRSVVAVAAIAWRADGSCWLTDAEGRELPGQLRAARILGPLIVLAFDRQGTRVELRLWPDSANADDLRRLRIRLQRGATATGDADSPASRTNS